MINFENNAENNGKLTTSKVVNKLITYIKTNAEDTIRRIYDMGMQIDMESLQNQKLSTHIDIETYAEATIRRTKRRTVVILVLGPVSVNLCSGAATFSDWRHFLG